MSASGKRMTKLFQALIWPAIAGSVGWALFTVLISEPWAGSEFWYRVALLVVLAIYLASDWIATEDELDSLKHWYWVGDAFHAITIAALAIAVQLNKAHLPVYLTFVLGVAAFWHLAGAWEPETLPNRIRKRFVFVGINVLGFVILAIATRAAAGSLVALPVALLVTDTLWIALRGRVYR
jgi:hypothetical protein